MAKALFAKEREESCRKCGAVRTFTLKKVGNFNQRTIMIALKVLMALLIVALAISFLSLLGFWPTKVGVFDLVVNAFLLALVMFGYNNMLSKAAAYYQCPTCKESIIVPPGA